jgi:hypothetical protein
MSRFLKACLNLLTGAGAVCLLSLQLDAQTNPTPATFLESFEQQTNIIVVKGFSLIGSVSVDNCSISVDAREANDITHAQKAYGILVETSRATESGGPARMALVVDYDELDSLAIGIDYISKVTWGVTQLNGFEASYTTRSGLKVIAHSDRRQQTVNTFIEFADSPRIPATVDELAQLRSLITQAKSALEALK